MSENCAHFAVLGFPSPDFVFLFSSFFFFLCHWTAQTQRARWKGNNNRARGRVSYDGGSSFFAHHSEGGRVEKRHLWQVGVEGRRGGRPT
jgi:hypothetical protein